MLVWERPDILPLLAPDIDLAAIETLRAERREKLSRPYFVQQAQALEALPLADDLPSPLACELGEDHVTCGKRSDLSDGQYDALVNAIHRLAPWRKGPFRLFDFEIDAEWKSNLKWDRIESALGPLEKRSILDVGCGNGYYMFRCAAQAPGLVLGIDPSVPFYFSFELFQRYLQLPNLQYELMGVDDLHFFDRHFDIVMCMGILYHHRSPIPILRDLLNTLKVGGLAIIESQTIPGDGSTALFPADRYAKARNVYFVPTRDCLINWVRRAGFKNVELVSHTRVTPQEQRATEFMPYESLSDFLDPTNPELTVEGYPAPYRTVVRAERQYL